MASTGDIRRSNGAFALLAVLLFVLTTAAVVVATGMGYIHIPPLEVAEIILQKVVAGGGVASGGDPLHAVVILDVRLPRILTACAVGAGLAVSGTIFQGILLNPLADPYTLGVSSGAAFGAALAFLLGMIIPVQFSVPLFAFAGALASLGVVVYLSSRDGQLSANTLILSGVIVGAILSAGISFIKYLADEQVSVIIFWLMGSFTSRGWWDVALVSATVVGGGLVAVYYARDLNIISLGSRISDSLGVETTRVRRILLVTSSLIAAVCVSVSGIIGFVGLIIPHLMRFVVGPDNRRLLLSSFPAGALLLLSADTVSRTLLPSEVPVGVLTALLGGPVFCYIFRRRQMGREHAGE